MSTQTRNTTTKTFSLPPDLAAQLKDAAEQEGIAESLIVRWALERFFGGALVSMQQRIPARFRPTTKKKGR